MMPTRTRLVTGMVIAAGMTVCVLPAAQAADKSKDKRPPNGIEKVSLDKRPPLYGV